MCKCSGSSGEETEAVKRSFGERFDTNVENKSGV